MKKLFLNVMFTAISMSFAQLCFAQEIGENLSLSDSTQQHRLYMKDESVLIGHLVSMNAQNWVLKYNNKEVTLVTSEIKSVEVYDPSHSDGKEWAENPNSAMVLVNPTAFPIKKGKVLLKSIYGVANRAEIGLGKGVSVGAGLVGILPSVSVRYGVNVYKKLYLGLSNSMVLNPIVLLDRQVGEGPGIVGMARANVTIGTPDKFLNFGGGIAYTASKALGFQQVPVFNIGGGLRLSKHFMLLSDNTIFVPRRIDKHRLSNYIVPSFAVRWMNKNVHFDVGVTSISISEFRPRRIVLPYLAFGYTFGNKKN